jgi:hypothetical protein
MTCTRKPWAWVLIGVVAVSIAVLFVIKRKPNVPEPGTESQPATVFALQPTSTLLSTATQPVITPQAQPPSELAIAGIQSRASVSLYENYEVSFKVTGTVATNLQWPYDPGPVSGMAPESLECGISVDGLFLPPGETNWAEAIIQPAFFYQPYLTDRETSAGTPNSEWIYPRGEAYWLVRFSPKLTGDWQFKIQAQDNSTYPGWSESAVRRFRVDEARLGNHGFVQVSQRDSRYFEYSDGTPYSGSGVNASDRGIFVSEQQAEAEFREKYASGKLNLARVGLAPQLVFARGSHEWDAWRTPVGTSDDLRSTEQVHQDHDFSVKISGENAYIFQASNGDQRLAGGLEADVTYVVRVTAFLGTTPMENLKVRLLAGAENFEAVLQELGPNDGWSETDLGDGWKRYESMFTNAQGRLLFSGRAALAVGVTTGTAYLDEVYIGEELEGGKVGPNVVFKGKLNYHQYFDPIASANWDLILEHAEQYGLALKLVISEKQDMILNRMSPEDGVFDPSLRLNPENFYSQRGNKVRRLQEYYWRYLAARWGYTRGVHSWELLNEGDPSSAAHRDQAVHLAQVMDSLDRNHLTTTSFWGGFPADFWAEASRQGLDYADVHAYISTGAGISPGITDNPVLEDDSAIYHSAYSQELWEKLIAAGGEMPVVRGEAGIDSFDQQREQAALAEDVYGVWLHNFIWAMLDPGGLYELYWWSDNIRNQPGPDGDTSNGLFEIFAPYQEFMSDIPLNTGGYVAINTTQPEDLLVAGQQNNGGSLSDQAHLWIRAADYTWKNVVDGVEPGSLRGEIRISGLAANTVFTVEWWKFNMRGELGIRTETVNSDTSGEIRLGLTNLEINGMPVTDAAVKIGK